MTLLIESRTNYIGDGTGLYNAFSVTGTAATWQNARPAATNFEIMYLTAFTSGATSGTVLRAQEGTLEPRRPDQCRVGPQPDGGGRHHLRAGSPSLPHRPRSPRAPTAARSPTSLRGPRPRVACSTSPRAAPPDTPPRAPSP